MTRVAGIDGYRRSWVAVVLVDNRLVGASAAVRLDVLIAWVGDLDVMGKRYVPQGCMTRLLGGVPSITLAELLKEGMAV